MSRKGLLLALVGLAATAGAAGTASAAAPAYCALYAREYAIDIVMPSAATGMLASVQDQAYYRCLNQDEAPPLPQRSAYFGTDLSRLTGSGTAVASTGTLSPASPADAGTTTALNVVVPKPTPAPDAPQAKAASPAPVVKARATAAQAPYHGSGMTAWTPEWKSWCADNFPNSWIPATGTILHIGSGTRELCK